MCDAVTLRHRDPGWGRIDAQFMVAGGRVLARGPVEFDERAPEVLNRASPGTKESREGGAGDGVELAHRLRRGHRCRARFEEPAFQ